MVGIDGLGGSGKSTAARNIKDNVPETTTIVMDDFYVPELARADWDRVYEQVVEPLSKGRQASYQRFDWGTGKLAEWHDVEPKGVIVVEGVYSVHRRLRDAYDYKIWVEAPHELRLERGIERDGESSRRQWVKEWMPREEEYKESQSPQEIADLIIDGSGR